MENCKDIQILLSPYLDQELDARQAKLVDDHILLCSACRGELEKLRSLTGLLGDLKKDEPPVDFPKNLNARLHNRRSLDSTLRNILNSPNIRVPVTLSVVAVLVFVVTQQILMSNYLHRSLQGRMKADEIGNQYSPGSIRKQTASLSEKQQYEPQQQYSIMESEKTTQSALMNIVPHTQDGATVTTMAGGAQATTTFNGNALMGNAGSERWPTANQTTTVANLAKVPSATPVVTNGKDDNTGFNDSITIRVANVRTALDNVREILKKYGIENIPVTEKDQAKNYADLLVSVPQEKLVALTEELKKISVETALVSLSPSTTKHSSVLCIRLKEPGSEWMTIDEKASATYTALMSK